MRKSNPAKASLWGVGLVLILGSAGALILAAPGPAAHSAGGGIPLRVSKLEASVDVFRENQNIQDVINAVLKQSIEETNEDLRFFADKQREMQEKQQQLQTFAEQLDLDLLDLGLDVDVIQRKVATVEPSVGELQECCDRLIAEVASLKDRVAELENPTD